MIYMMLTSWPFGWDLVSYFHILAEGLTSIIAYEVKNRARFFWMKAFERNLSQKVLKASNDNWGIESK